MEKIILKRETIIFLCLLAELVLGGKVALCSEKKEISVKVEILSQYVGTFKMGPGTNFMITLEGDKLMGQMSGQSKAPLFAESETKFFPKVVEAEIEFFKDENGVVTHLVLRQNSAENKAVRTSDKVLERKEITLAPDTLSQYVGTYELSPGFDLVITLEGGQLFSQATGQAKVQIFAETETNFFLKAVDAQIVFFKDESGKVSQLVLHQGPAEIKAQKK